MMFQSYVLPLRLPRAGAVCALQSSLMFVAVETGQNLTLLHALQKQPANPLAGLSEKKPSEATVKS